MTGSPGGELLARFAENPFLMAPMAGVSDGAYRVMARRHGAALAYTEMVSVAGIHYRSEKTWELVFPAPDEPEVAVQLFGHEPDQFREAAEKVAERLGKSLALMDINMACPVPKVTKGGGGSALLDEPEVASRIVRACVEAADVPVTVKIRRGRRMGEEVASEFARAMEAAGASAVAVHGRFANQMYHGEADWGCVRRVADAVSVPVIGSGDVSSAEAAARMLGTCGCSAVMIARGTYGNPWVFDDARALTRGEAPEAHGSLDRVRAFAEHVRLLDAYGLHMVKARSLSGWYLRGMADAGAWRSRAMACSKAEEFLSVASELESALMEGAPDG